MYQISQRGTRNKERYKNTYIALRAPFAFDGDIGVLI